MIAYLQSLIAALREELHEYGEMLARLDEQQELVMKREADGILASVSTIQDQSAGIQRAREIRETRQNELAQHLGLEIGRASCRARGERSAGRAEARRTQ